MRVLLFVRKELPDFGVEIEKISLEDGCKVYFTDGTASANGIGGRNPGTG